MSRNWTFPELHRVATRLQSGERVATIATEMGSTESAVRSALSRHGLADAAARDRRARGKRWRVYARAMALRKVGFTWREAHQVVCRELGYRSSVHSLKQGVRLYRRALGRGVA